MSNLKAYIESHLTYITHLRDFAKRDGSDAAYHYLDGVAAGLESVKDKLDNTKEEPLLKADDSEYRIFMEKLDAYDFALMEELSKAKTPYDTRRIIVARQKEFLAKNILSPEQQVYLNNANWERLARYEDRSK